MWVWSCTMSLDVRSISPRTKIRRSINFCRRDYLLLRISSLGRCFHMWSTYWANMDWLNRCSNFCCGCSPLNMRPPPTRENLLNIMRQSVNWLRNSLMMNHWVTLSNSYLNRCSIIWDHMCHLREELQLYLTVLWLGTWESWRVF